MTIKSSGDKKKRKFRTILPQRIADCFEPFCWDSNNHINSCSPDHPFDWKEKVWIGQTVPQRWFHCLRFVNQCPHNRCLCYFNKDQQTIHYWQCHKKLIEVSTEKKVNSKSDSKSNGLTKQIILKSIFLVFL